MANENEISTGELQFGNELIEVIYRKAQPLSEFAGVHGPGPAPKVEFKPGTTLLKKGTTFIDKGMALPCDIIWERDTGVKMRDGVIIYADIFRPVGGKDLPAILSWSPYGKGLPQYPPAGVAPTAVSGLQKFEGPDPAYWCDHSYAVINVDSRGSYYSEGDIHFWGTQDANDTYDFVEWAASQNWCNGKVTMSGNSWLGIVQWFAAASHPPHLAAIAPWEGHIDLYRYDVRRGGIADTFFNNNSINSAIGKNLIEDMAAMAYKYPLMNAYWEDKAAKLERINIPAYIVASWDVHHTIDAFRRISSGDKWLRVHNTQEWPDYYEYTEDLRRFYDHYVKGIDNGWEKTPRVRLSILNPGGVDQVNRPEDSWPVAGTKYKKLYLDASSRTLIPEPVAKESSYRYKADDRESEVIFTYDIDKDTDFTGYVSLHLWVEAESANDADVFVLVYKADNNGQLLTTGLGFVGPDGRLRASHRSLDSKRSTPWFPYHPHDKEDLLKPGQIVPLDIEIRPIGMHLKAGEKLQLVVAGYNVLGRLRPTMNLSSPVIHNEGYHNIHTGGLYDSYLLMPELP